MAYVPKFGHLWKMMFGVRDPDAAEGLFMEASIEFENGNLKDAQRMFLFGTRLDPNLGGNFYNHAVVTEKIEGASAAAIKAWERYCEAAERDPKQSREVLEKAKTHVSELRSKAR